MTLPSVDRPPTASTDPLAAYRAAAAAHPGRVEPLLSALAGLDPSALTPLPGSGDTAERFAALAGVAGVDVTAARVLEPHLDAVAILAEAGHSAPPAGTTWGVFAAEGSGASLEARHDPGRADAEGWTLHGVKPWCSLGDRLTDALVTARTADGERRMFAIRLTRPQVIAEPVAWVARGLPEVASGPLRFTAASAVPVGGPGWYLERPGFRWGALGVAACWHGGCLPLLRALIERASARPDDALTGARVGEVYRLLVSARLQLTGAAAAVDAGDDAAALAHVVRGSVADAVIATLGAVRDVLGPAALAFDDDLARRCADLELYVSQYHRGRDDASLAAKVAASPEEDRWW